MYELFNKRQIGKNFEVEQSVFLPFAGQRAGGEAKR